LVHIASGPSLIDKHVVVAQWRLRIFCSSKGSRGVAEYAELISHQEHQGHQEELRALAALCAPHTFVALVF
jgi:hypothetical protein